MIDREYGKFVLVCDICGEEVTGFDTFDEALEHKSKEGWRSRRGQQLDLKEGFVDICPACIERGN